MATIRVPSDYPTISAAITAASPGDTIIVDPGVYNEAITINKALTLLGAGADINPVSVGRPGGESTIDSQFAVTIAASDIIFNGFEVRNFRYGINIPAASFPAPNYTVQNITIKYNWMHATNATIGFNAEPGLLRNLVISHNIISVNNVSPGGDDYALAAIGFSSGATATPTYENIKIVSNEIANLSSEGAYGLFAGADPGAYLINKMEISCNHFINVSTGANYNIGNILDGKFSNNVVDNAGGSIGIQSGVVSGNTFRNGGSLSLWGTEFGFTRPSANLCVVNNEFMDEITGNGLRIRLGALANTIAVHNNAFRNSGIAPSTPPDYTEGYLIRNTGMGTLDATLNWWDSSCGPTGNTGGLAGSIIVSPWITAYFDASAKQAPFCCWPLSTFMTTRPGFWPRYISSLCYVGKSSFMRNECVALPSQVSFNDGNAGGIPVEFDLAGRKCQVNTQPGGIACLCFEHLSPGVYPLTVSAIGFSDRQNITVTNS